MLDSTGEIVLKMPSAVCLIVDTEILVGAINQSNCRGCIVEELQRGKICSGYNFEIVAGELGASVVIANVLFIYKHPSVSMVV